MFWYVPLDLGIHYPLTLYKIGKFFMYWTKGAKWMEGVKEANAVIDWNRRVKMRCCVCEPVAKAAHTHNYTVRFGAYIIIIIIMFEWRKKSVNKIIFYSSLSLSVSFLILFFIGVEQKADRNAKFIISLLINSAHSVAMYCVRWLNEVHKNK